MLMTNLPSGRLVLSTHEYQFSNTQPYGYGLAMLPVIRELVMTDIEFDAAVDRDAANHPPHPDDGNVVCVWADGTTCAYEDRAEYLAFMSDDYEVVTLIESHIGHPIDRPFVCPIEWSPEDDVPF